MMTTRKAKQVLHAEIEEWADHGFQGAAIIVGRNWMGRLSIGCERCMQGRIIERHGDAYQALVIRRWVSAHVLCRPGG